MTYKCDICPASMPSKSDGTFFDQNRVLTSPGYWEYLYTEAPLPLDEKGIGLTAAFLCKDTSGFTVCERCKNMLQ
jgi:hypothetical protein